MTNLKNSANDAACEREETLSPDPGGSKPALTVYEVEDETVRERAHELADAEVAVGSKPVRRGDIFKIVGLLAFLVLSVVVVIALWPYFGKVFEPGGIDRLVETVRNAGPWGVGILLGLQLLQVIVAFIPGEVVQVAAGVIYGPWWGAVIIIFGCYISMWIIYELVHRLGRPFVNDMVSANWLERFDSFEASGKLDTTVFILFLIPGMPKDVFSYIVPLTGMPRRKYLILANIARIPGVLASTFAAAGLMDGHIGTTIAIFGVLGAIAIVAIIFKDKIISLIHKGDRS
ncbi:TVP38/TMEM64 family protein [Curtanaerobium respiraculi]|uniref:TVP38/TMEM64 family protein n=1 Tax=Curtanaerobium respiraculi TaxID=2949669 RepID=UPI0024B3951E|nr:VTT domain-containing protein [Curtanaerobium respiraculi]